MFFDERLPVRHKREQGGQQRKGQHDGAEQCKSQGQRDGGENLSFNPLEGEDWYESHNNDGFGEEHGARHIGQCPMQDMHAFADLRLRAMRAGHRDRQADHEGFDDHDGAVDDDAEVDCTERNQVGRYAERIHQDKSDEQRERNHGGDHQRGDPA